MRTVGRQEGSTAVQPVKQKVRVYNPSLLSELLHEAEKAKQLQAQVRGRCGVSLCSGCKLLFVLSVGARAALSHYIFA